MEYDFDRLASRKGTHCCKWDEFPDVDLPLWVADMDFPCAKPIQEAIQAKAAIGAYGYSILPDSFFEAFRDFWSRRHHVEFSPSWMVYSTGVVPTISSCVKRFTKEGDSVLIQAPVYNIFYNSIRNAHRTILSSDLVYRNGVYSVDWEDLEEKLSRPTTSMMILCNPHNPVGKLWSKEELERIGALCAKHHVLVLSDEIHCDLVIPGKEYVPFASVNEVNRMNSITALSCSKAFNVAGLGASIAVVPNEETRKKVYRALNDDECGEPTFFSVEPTIAALTRCDDWLDQVLVYIDGNRSALTSLLEEGDPSITVVHAEATYLLWVDLSAYTEDSDAFIDAFSKAEHVFFNSGAAYGPTGKSFVRINLATSRANVLEAGKRLLRYLKSIH